MTLSFKVPRVDSGNCNFAWNFKKCRCTTQNHIREANLCKIGTYACTIIDKKKIITLFLKMYTYMCGKCTDTCKHKGNNKNFSRHILYLHKIHIKAKMINYAVSQNKRNPNDILLSSNFVHSKVVQIHHSRFYLRYCLCQFCYTRETK